MRPELVTVLWVEDGVGARLPAFLDKRDVARVVVSASDLERAVSEARNRGGVVVGGTADSASETDRLLALGADELVSSDCSPAELDEAVRRARARAIWRTGEAHATTGGEVASLALLTAAMGHEIRNPLTAATLNCHVLQDVVPTLTEVIEEMTDSRGLSDPGVQRIQALIGEISFQDVRDALHDLGAALRTVSDVVTDMVTFSEEAPVAACDLTRVLVELTTLVHRDVERWGVFTVELPDHPCVVAMSRVLVLEVVSSLLSNATHALRGRDDGTIGMRLSHDAGMVVVEVTDNGTGMAPDVRRQALNPFFSTRRPGAVGMGLTFAALHVRRAGGEILIDSEPGVGTNVRLFLPPALSVVSVAETLN